MHCTEANKFLLSHVGNVRYFISALIALLAAAAEMRDVNLAARVFQLVVCGNGATQAILLSTIFVWKIEIPLGPL